MVVLLAGVDAEAQHHHVEEGRLGQADAAGAVVVAGVEVQLVHARAVVIALQHRRIATAVVVGGHAVDQLQLRAFDAVQLDLDVTPRTAVRGVQYMRSQTSHGSRVSAVAGGRADTTPPLLC